MPKVPIELAKKVLSVPKPSLPRTIFLSSEEAARDAFLKIPMKDATEKALLKIPDLSEEEVEKRSVMESLAEAGEFGESGASNLAFGSGLASLAKVKGAAGLAGKAGTAAGVATLALNGVDLVRTLTDDDYREEVKTSLEGMDGWDGFQQGLTRLPSTVNALQSVNLDTADQFQQIEDQDANTDRQLFEMRKRKKARQAETNKINEDQRRALENPGAEEKTRIAKMEEQKNLAMVRPG